jgi:SAM-dependent methyltransferase
MGRKLLSFLLPARLKHLRKRFADRPFRILDVGCGNQSASLTKKHFPNCEYYGIDRTRAYSNTPADFLLMRQFFEMDVSRLEFAPIPDAFFDVVMMSHILEHLENGDQVVEGLVKKLKKGGILYIEYPAKCSTRFPSMKGTLNFYDDPTHIHLYDIPGLASLLKRCGCTVLISGTRRDWIRVLLTPARIVWSKITLGYVSAVVFWDILGFAEFLIAERTQPLEVEQSTSQK